VTSQDELEILVRYDPESTHLDFKRQPYVKGNHGALLKDLLSMANAPGAGVRRIVLGVVPQPGENELVGIPSDAVVDDADYQSLVRENIEPGLRFSYREAYVTGVRLAVFEIAPTPQDRPYSMRKEFGSLRRGEAWIRKGSSQHLFTREDYESIYAARRANALPVVHIGFPGEPLPVAAMKIVAASRTDLPSDRARAEITAILQRRTINNTLLNGSVMWNVSALASPFGEPRPYAQRPNDELQDDLKSVTSTYAVDDKYEMAERRSEKLNPVVFNEGETPLEDAIIELDVPALDGVSVAHSRPFLPERSHTFMPRDLGIGHNNGYPSVSKRASTILVKADVGLVRPSERRKVFGRGLRITFDDRVAGQEIAIAYRLFARTLPRPVAGELRYIIAAVPLDRTA
jgi:hypothetical protein